MHKGIDCAAKLTAKTAAAARAAGYDFVGRYLVPNSGALAWKALTKTEAESITKAGLRLLCVWETAADRAKSGYNGGRADGARARECAEAIGMPERGVIYFAVDYDAQAGEMETVASYLRGAREQTGPYEIGVYGSYRVIEAMAARGACRGFWQCVAWSGGKKSPRLTVYQSHWPGAAAAKTAAAKTGVSVDLNECPDMDAAGIWDYSASLTPAAGEKQKQSAQTEKGDEEMDIEKLTDEQCYRIIEKAQAHAAALPPPDWALDELEEARARGVTDGTRPMALPTRAEAAIMALRTMRK